MSKTKSDLFKQAIAEAKTIREAAISNAKDALSESITPAIKELLAKQLEEEEEIEEEEEVSEESMKKHTSSPGSDQDWKKSKDLKETEEVEEAEEIEEEEEIEEPEEEEEAEIEEPEVGSEEEAEEVEDMDMEDLKNLIRDILAQELGDETMPGDEGELGDMGDETPDMIGMEPEEEEEDEYSLEQMLKELENELEEEEVSEEEEVEERVDATDELARVTKERDEAVDALRKVTSQLSEVNVLNAKLLYLNKIFKAYTLSENQKVKIVGAFDKATSTKEAKLVYESLTANIGDTSKKESKTIKEHKSFASNAAGKGTKKPEILTEEAKVIDRWQQIAKIGKYKKQ